MAKGVELGVAYLTLAASTRGFVADIGKGLAQGEKEAAKSGKRMGKAIKDGIDSAKPIDTSKLTDKVKADQERLAAAVQQSSRKQEDATRKVEIAHQRLKEVRDKYAAGSSQVLAAEERFRQAINKSKDVASQARASQEMLTMQVSRSKQELAEAERKNRELAKSTRQAADEADAAAKRYSGFGGAIRKAIEEARNAFKGGFGNAFGGIKSDGDSAAGSLSESFGESAEKSSGAFTEKFSGAFKGLLGAGVAAGAALGASVTNGIADNLEQSGIKAKMSASLALPPADAELAGKVTADMYKLGFSESYEGVAKSVTAVISSIPNITDNEQQFREVTRNVLAMSDAMGIEATASAGALTTMLSAGLAKDGVEATQILTAGLQKIPEAFRGEAIDAFHEYADEFSAMGYTGEEAMAMLAAGAQQGQYGIDKTADAIKEFQIKATDGSKSSADAFAAIGLNATDMSNKLLTGGDTAKDAMGQIIDGLLGIKDPSAQAQAAIGLFGTPLEDMGVTQIPSFLEGLQSAQGGLGDFQNAAQAMSVQLIDSDAARIEQFKRTISQGWAEAVSGLVDAMVWVVEAIMPIREFLIDTKDQWGPFAAGLGIAATAAGLWASKSAIATAATTAWAWATGGLAAGLAAVNWPIVAAVAAIGLLIGAIIYAYNHFDWFKNAVDGVWNWIKQVIAGFVDWWTAVAWPAILDGLQRIGGKFVWLYENVVKPVWGWISDVVGGFVNWLVTVAIPWMSDALKTLGGWFSWLNDNIIQPVWYGIRVAIAAAVAIIMTIFEGLWWLISHTIGPVFLWLWNEVISPVFNWIKEKIQAVIGWIVENTGPALSNAIEGWKIIFRALWDVVSNVFSWVWGKISRFIGWLVDVVSPIIGGAVGFWKDVFRTFWDIVSKVFGWIWGKISRFVGWLNETITPIIRASIEGWKIIFHFLWDKVSTVFNWIMGKIGRFVGWFNDHITPIIRDSIEGWKIIFHSLWEKISTVWSWIASKISRVWNWILENVLKPGMRWIRETFGPVWDWLSEKIGRVWNWISDKISNTWNGIRENVFKPMGNFLTNDLVGMFTRAKDGIGRTWDKLRDKVKEPVRFVVDTVINGGFIKNYNKIADKFKVDKLPEVKLPDGFATGGVVGYARGGILPGYQSRKKDELLTPMRKGEGVLVPEAVQALGHDFIHGVNNAANGGGIRGAELWKKKQGIAAGDGHNHGHSAGYGWAGSHFSTSGATPPSGGSGIWGGHQAAASRAGAMSFPDTNFMGVSTKKAAMAWMGRSALNVNTDGKGPGVSVGYGSAGPWGFNMGSSVQVNPSAPRNMVLSILMHEFGHALSLGHTNNGASLMHPAIAGVKSPSATDYAALRSAWGKPGEGVKTYDINGGDDGGFSLRDVLQPLWDSTIGKWMNGALDGFSNMFPGNPVVGLGTAAMKKIVQGGFDFILGNGEDDGGGSRSGGDWTGTVKDALKRVGLPVRDDYVSVWKKQIQSESGGNPRAVQGGYTDINSITGDLAKGLVQVIGSTFNAYRDPTLPNDRFNPLANLVAAMNYAKARYGTSGMLGVIGKGHGYAKGGIIGDKPGLYDDGGLIQGKGLRLIDHQRSTPDYVLTENQWNAIYKLADRQMQAPKQGGITIESVYGLNPEDVAAEVMREQRKNRSLMII